MNTHLQHQKCIYSCRSEVEMTLLRIQYRWPSTLDARERRLLYARWLQ